MLSDLHATAVNALRQPSDRRQRIERVNGATQKPGYLELDTPRFLLSVVPSLYRTTQEQNDDDVK